MSISVFGRFRAFYLAHQLHKRGHLAQLITTYPRFEVVKYGVPSAKTVSLVWLELLNRVWHRAPEMAHRRIDLVPWLHDLFDAAASKRLDPESDLFVGWSGVSERALLTARAQGMVAVIERGSSHIEFQRDILIEEYDRYGLGLRPPHPEIVAKEVREYELADYISIPSAFVEKTFLAKGVPKAKLLRNGFGVDLSQFRQLPRRDQVYRVLFAGRLDLRKGVHYLLQAFSELRLPNAELWLLGNKLPEIEPFFSRYAGSFIYHGHIPQWKLHEYYSQCSVFAIASIEEGMAVVQLQAMACGLPLICTTNTGGEDVITDGREGFVVPIRDVEALKEKIMFLYENQDICREMGQAARLRVETGLTWDDYGRRVCQTYSRILREAHPCGQ